MSCETKRFANAWPQKRKSVIPEAVLLTSGIQTTSKQVVSGGMSSVKADACAENQMGGTIRHVERLMNATGGNVVHSIHRTACAFARATSVGFLFSSRNCYSHNWQHKLGCWPLIALICTLGQHSAHRSSLASNPL